MSHTGFKELGVAEFIERFDELFDAAERGETIRIWREGKPIARMEPHAEKVADEGAAGSS